MVGSAPRVSWGSAIGCGSVGGLAASALLEVAGGRIVLLAFGIGALAAAISPSGPLHHDRLGGERWYRGLASLAALCCPAWMLMAERVGVDGTARGVVGLTAWSAATLVVVPALPARDRSHAVAAATGIGLLGLSAAVALAGLVLALVPLLAGAALALLLTVAPARPPPRRCAVLRAALVRCGDWLRERTT